MIVTSDRLSAFDRNLAVVPYKGQVLNQLSAWWFEQTRSIVANHMLAVPDPNAMLVVKVEPFPVEVIVRGYITGVTSTALWRRYELGEREIYGYTFPEGLRKNQVLPEAILTPTTKGGPTGHDERLTCQQVTQWGLLDPQTWDKVQEAALGLFKQGQAMAARAGLILVDTKYEFGRAPDGQILLIDEVHTPDSSRFWNAASYQARFEQGEEAENFDKEFIRLAYVERGYRGEGEPPVMPADLWASASQRYIDLFERLSGGPFMPGSYPVGPRLEENYKEGWPAMSVPLLVILMGSKADSVHCQKIVEAAQQFGLEVVQRIGSAHKTPAHVLKLLAEYEAGERPVVYITVAGRSNALSGFVDGAVSAPVIACPPPGEAFGGADVFSSLRMPSGIAPALVLEPANAALCAAKIFAMHDPAIRQRVWAFQQQQAQKVINDDANQNV